MVRVSTSSESISARGIHFTTFPAHHIQWLEAGFFRLAAIDGDHQAALGTVFANVAALNVAGKEDQLILR